MMVPVAPTVDLLGLEDGWACGLLIMSDAKLSDVDGGTVTETSFPGLDPALLMPCAVFPFPVSPTISLVLVAPKP